MYVIVHKELGPLCQEPEVGMLVFLEQLSEIDRLKAFSPVWETADAARMLVSTIAPRIDWHNIDLLPVNEDHVKDSPICPCGNCLVTSSYMVGIMANAADKSIKLPAQIMN